MKPKMSVKIESEDEQGRLAVLIDADNAQPSVLEGLLAEVAKFGIASVKRIYGDWTSSRHSQWKKSLLKHSITPVQQFAYTSGKNATDSSLIIDAMDLLYTRRFDGFCLVSSDSDFTRLAQRLREEGQTVYGFGEKKTPEAFVAVCDKFIFTEILRPEELQTSVVAEINASAVEAASKPTAPKSIATPPVEIAIPVPSGSLSVTHVSLNGDSVGSEKALLPEDFISQAIIEASDESGWVTLAYLGSYLTKIQPGFDPRLYGCKKLSDLLLTRAQVCKAPSA